MMSGLVGASLPWAFQKSFSACSSNSFAIVTTSSIPSIPSSGSTFPSTHYLLQKLQPCRTRILVPRIKMSQSKVDEHHPVVQVERITVKNNHGENLVGLLHETGSKELVILCHGFRSSKESAVMADLADAISKEGISVFRFDFAGNGESEGSFQYGNYLREADDLRSVIQYLSGRNHAITTILGHSKGGDVVLLYASKYRDVPTIINVAGRYDLKKGIAERMGKDFMEVIKRDGFIDVVSKKGQYRVTEESLMERLGTDMHAACLSIDNGCRVLTVHGSSDEVISVEDAYAFAKIIPNHELHIIEGADHKFSKHQAELAEVVLNFIKTSIQEGKDEA